jgi:glycosyltransferase involved in cell wall biosynthesis
MQNSTSRAISDKSDIFCSAIIPTVGRSTLARAVESVLNQELSHADFEVIVINDSGKPLPEANWQKSDRVQVIDTYRHERSVARNTGAATSRGKYLHFLDDDDWILPGAYEHFWELSQSSSAKWLYGLTQLVDRQNNPIIQLRHELKGNCFLQVMSGEWIPLQSSIIERTTFMRIGGFNPLLSGPEDIDLLRRILLEEEIDRTPHIVSCVGMGEEGSTTNYIRHPVASRLARESILDAQNTYSRMHTSVQDHTWRGRMLRIYLTSILWNLQHARFFKAFSRAIFSFATFLSAGPALFSTSFWKSLLKPYASVTFEQGFQAARKE